MQAIIPKAITIEGKYIILKPCSPIEDGQELYDISHGSKEKESIWTYIYMIGAKTPFPTVNDFIDMLSKQCAPVPHNSVPPFVVWTVIDKATKQKIGCVGFVTLAPEHKRIEMGPIWLGKQFHGTFANLEANFLLLTYAFECLGYNRVEWRCDGRNTISKRAAVKLGFTFDGTFRKHMIVSNGVIRDTDWFSIINDDWLGNACKKNKLQKERLRYNEEDDERLSQWIKDTKTQVDEEAIRQSKL